MSTRESEYLLLFGHLLMLWFAGSAIVVVGQFCRPENEPAEGDWFIAAEFLGRWTAYIEGPSFACRTAESKQAKWTLLWLCWCAYMGNISEKWFISTFIARFAIEMTGEMCPNKPEFMIKWLNLDSQVLFLLVITKMILWRRLDRSGEVQQLSFLGHICFSICSGSSDYCYYIESPLNIPFFWQCSAAKVLLQIMQLSSEIWYENLFITAAQWFSSLFRSLHYR